jgi:hypothetical protein
MPGLLPVFLMLAMRGLRRRFVYPRIGFARPRSDFSVATLFAVVALLGLVVAVVFVTGHSILGWLPGSRALGWMFALPAFGGAALLASVAVRAGRPRFWLHAGVLAAAAVVPLVLGLKPREQLFFATFAPAVTMLPTGTIVFIRFLRSHPVQEVQDDA